MGNIGSKERIGKKRFERIIEQPVHERMEHSAVGTKARPYVGVAVIVARDNRVLLGKRKGAHGAGGWQFPGGHLEFNESIEACARREVLEETGLYIKNLRLGPYTNDIFHKDKKHYVTLFVVAEYDNGTVEVKEPDKCEQWAWFEWARFPDPLFLPTENLLEQGYDPFTEGRYQKGPFDEPA